MSVPSPELLESVRRVAPELLVLLEPGPEPDLWELRLAVAPSFPDTVAKALGAPEALADLADRGLVSLTRQSGGGTLAWVGPEVRSDILLRARAKATGDVAARLLGIALELEEACRRVGLARLPRTLRFWCALVGATRGRSPQAAADVVGKQLAAEVANALVGGGWQPDAQEWIEAAEALAPLFGASIEVAVARARQALRRSYALQEDRRLLERFFTRIAPIAAFERLLDAPAPGALHLLGPGGSGKSMLIRHLRIAPLDAPRRRGRGFAWYRARRERGETYTAARIDFDYLSPDFPSRSPGLVLLTLADELRSCAFAPEAEQAIARLEQRVGDLEANASLRRHAGDDWAPGSVNGKLIEDFLDLLDALGERAVLLLDTCEEVERAGAGVSAVRALVAMTGALLQQAAQRAGRARGVRVVFSGRRPLADRGGREQPWQVPSGRVLERGEAPWMELYEVPALDAAEARAFLLARVPPERRDLIPPILGAIPAATPSPVATSPPLGRRYLAYDLAMYADWAESPTPPGADDLRRGVTRYVQLRLIDRSAELTRLWPLLAAFGEADAAMLQASGTPAAAADAVLRNARQTEWALRSPGTPLGREPIGSGRVGLPAELYARVAQWGESQPWRLSDVRRRVLDGLYRRLTAGERDGLSVEHVVLLLRHAGTSAWPGGPAGGDVWSKLAGTLELHAHPDLAARVVAGVGTVALDAGVEQELLHLGAELQIGDATVPLPRSAFSTAAPDARTRAHSLAVRAAAARANPNPIESLFDEPEAPELASDLARLLENAPLDEPEVAVAVLAATELVFDTIEQGAPAIHPGVPRLPAPPAAVARVWALRAAWNVATARAHLLRGESGAAEAALRAATVALDTTPTPAARVGWNQDLSPEDLWNRLCFDVLTIAASSRLDVPRPPRPYLGAADTGLTSRVLAFYPEYWQSARSGDRPRLTRRPPVGPPAAAVSAARDALAPGPESQRVAAERRLLELHRVLSEGADVPPPDVAWLLRRVAIVRRTGHDFPESLWRLDLVATPGMLLDVANWHLLASRHPVTPWPPPTRIVNDPLLPSLYSHAALRVAQAADAGEEASRAAHVVLRKEVFPFAEVIGRSDTIESLLLTLDVLALTVGWEGQAAAFERVLAAAERFRHRPDWYARLVVPASVLAGRDVPAGLGPATVLTELAVLAVRAPALGARALRSFASRLEDPYLRVCALVAAGLAGEPGLEERETLASAARDAFGGELRSEEAPVSSGVEAALTYLSTGGPPGAALPRVPVWGVPGCAWEEKDEQAIGLITGGRPSIRRSSGDSGRTRPPDPGTGELELQVRSSGARLELLLESTSTPFVFRFGVATGSAELRLGDPYADIRARLRGEVPLSTPIVLDLDAPSETVAWEAALPRVEGLPVAVRRRSRGVLSSFTPGKVLLQPAGELDVAGQLARWAVHAPRPEVLVRIQGWAAPDAARGQVVHLRGTALLQGGSPSFYPSRSDVRDRGGGLDASRVAATRPAVVLLEMPFGPSDRQLPADRIAAATLRAYGAELARLGVPLVVLLPSVADTGLLDRVLGAALATTRGESPDWPALVAEVRHRVMTSLVGELSERAFDLQLWAPDPRTLTARRAPPGLPPR